MPVAPVCTARDSNLLLVEDNLGHARLAQEALREAGFCGKIDVVHDGEAAMNFVRRKGKFDRSPTPDLILLDLNLPRKNGWEVLEEIKADAKLRRIPVLILSTSARSEDIDAAYDLHANCYLSKPSDLAALMDVGRLITGFWLKTAKLSTAAKPPLRRAARKTS